MTIRTREETLVVNSRRIVRNEGADFIPLLVETAVAARRLRHTSKHPRAEESWLALHQLFVKGFPHIVLPGCQAVDRHRPAAAEDHGLSLGRCHLPATGCTLTWVLELPCYDLPGLFFCFRRLRDGSVL